MAFEIKIEGLDRLNKSFKKSPQIVRAELARGIKSSVLFLQIMEKREAPEDTGKLRRNIEAKTDLMQLKGTVRPNLKITPYALYVHSGTSPYIIRPKTKPFLAWQKGGKWFYAKQVRHPGIKANPFIERTIKKSDNQINKIFGKLTDRIIKHLGQ